MDVNTSDSLTYELMGDTWEFPEHLRLTEEQLNSYYPMFKIRYLHLAQTLVKTAEEMAELLKRQEELIADMELETKIKDDSLYVEYIGCIDEIRTELKDISDKTEIGFIRYENIESMLCDVRRDILGDDNRDAYEILFGEDDTQKSEDDKEV